MSDGPRSPAAAWRAYTEQARPVVELLDRRRDVGERLARARGELAELRSAAEDARRELDVQARRAEDLWDAFADRIGSAAGAVPAPRADGTDAARHLERAGRAAAGPIRFPLLAVSLRMAGYGLAGAAIYCLAMYGVMAVIPYWLAGVVLHVVALVLFFLGLAGAPAIGYLSARRRFDVATGGEDDRPALVGFLAGCAVAVAWLAIVLVRTIALLHT